MALASAGAPFCAMIAPHEVGLCRSHWLDNGLGSLRRNMGSLVQPGSKPGRWQSSASAGLVGHEHCLHRHCAVLGRVLLGSLAATRAGRVHARLADGTLASAGTLFLKPNGGWYGLGAYLFAAMDCGWRPFFGDNGTDLLRLERLCLLIADQSA
jgi:hypothetical protein